MLFSTFPFFAFLSLVLISFWLAPAAWRRWLLLLASYYFYMSWNPRFVPLLAALTAIDFYAALWIGRVGQRWRRPALIASITANLGFLGFFKYYNFLGGMVASAMGRPVDTFLLAIILPLGISFHTFQSMSYVIDVYRGRQDPIRDPVDYALFISFFPQLVAGPIVRAREFFGDLYDWRPPSAGDIRLGVLTVFFGLTKKVVCADQCTLLVDRYFSGIAAHPGFLPAWSAAATFAAQVYFDFSGYSDMAIGMALLFGFRFPENFRRPFLSDCITEYWQRWHMTLSRWFRDYLYFPLAGRRVRTARSYGALLVVLLLVGLWHGAAWRFVVWGGYLGVVMCLERLLGIRPLRFKHRPWLYVLRVPVAFLVFAAGTGLFRAPDLHVAGAVYRQMFAGEAGAPLLNVWQIWLAAITLLLAILEEWLGWFARVATGPLWVYGGVLALLLMALELFSVTEVSVPFIYFQF